MARVIIQRPYLTPAEKRQEVPRAVMALVDAHNAVQRQATATDVVVEEIQETGVGASSEGSIFSMTPPTGAANPIVVYDFANYYDSTLSDALNVTAANRSGDSSLNLSIVGTAVPRFISHSGAAGQMPLGFTPYSAGTAGGALFSGAGGTSYVVTSGFPSALRFQSAMTAEWLGYVSVVPSGAGDCQFFNFTGSGETEDVNSQYLLFWRDSDTKMLYFHEHGAGVDDEAGFFVAPETIYTPSLALPLHLTLTRTAAGVVRLYINGRLVSAAVTPTTTALPTGGTAADLRISQGGDAAVKLATLGMRLFNVQLTDAQVRESYHRTFFGLA